MKITVIISFLCLFTASYSQVDKKVLEEPSSDAIVLSDITEFIIESPQKATTKRTYEFLLKNSKAKDLKNVFIYYDQFLDVKNADVFILDMLGNEVEKFKLKDFNDIAVGLSNTASDGRMKLLRPTYNKYPFKIKVEYQVEKEGSLHYPIWDPQPTERLRIVSATFKVIDKAGDAFRYKEINVSPSTIIKQEGNTEYLWEIRNLSPYEYERYNKNSEDYEPIVYTAPNAFEVEGYKGDMSTWRSFGLWAQQLNSEKNDLDETKLEELDKLVNNVSDELEKAKIVYNFLQTNTRYVSIQLGIGGWQPFNASYVQNNKYGDCKALSYFTKSLLERYGIKSYYTLIRAGANAADMSEKFANAHFNHAIVTLPIKQDTIFLECTSQTNPFGYMGTFTSDRNALMITENGGKLIRTKKYSPSENVQSTKVSIILNETGKADVDVKRYFTGIEIDNHRFSNLYLEPADEHQKWIKDNYDWSSNADINNIELFELKEGVVPSTGFEVSLKNYQAGKKMGKRYFLKPGRFINSYLSKISAKKREKPIRVRYGYTQIDTINYNLPKYLKIEMGIEPVNISTEFGEYFLETIREEDKLIYVRKMMLFDGNYNPDKYDGFKDFINGVVKNDRRQIVLLNKT